MKTLKLKRVDADRALVARVRELARHLARGTRVHLPALF